MYPMSGDVVSSVFWQRPTSSARSVSFVSTFQYAGQSSVLQRATENWKIRQRQTTLLMVKQLLIAVDKNMQWLTKALQGDTNVAKLYKGWLLHYRAAQKICPISNIVHEHANLNKPFMGQGKLFVIGTLFFLWICNDKERTCHKCNSRNCVSYMCLCAICTCFVNKLHRNMCQVFS